MTDIHIRIENQTGRITLNRPAALNAMTYDMCMAIDAALRDWRDNPAVVQVMFDAEGDKAFCAGGDIAELYRTGRAGDYAYGRRFWRDEYRVNAMIAAYPKPVISFLHGFTMGGGVGIGCHGSLRIVGDSSRIALPECGIGLVPDVGGSRILARLDRVAPGLGAWIGATGLRLAHVDATLGFADRFQHQSTWEETKSLLIGNNKATLPDATPPDSEIRPHLARMAAHFATGTPAEILESLKADPSEPAQTAAKALQRACPLSVACHIEILRRLGPDCSMEDALRMEYRFTWRCMEHGDFLEGIRAQIIDKDRSPKWRHASLAAVTAAEVEAMLAPLGDDELTFH
ncbi:enoyl-CoA hydratase/isomerase family protein [Seohaeicola nanhaiensis]|uniref:3-hydroxyisobutyryl-CoA hydrolase n=1 Tax=Seohaeicola nanhaiensis TaxID=1387282 RepID=A0ABV9KJT7_9RHOB